jgi:hypothetical protein
MKKFSQPQVIILLDFLFIFLIILILQQPSKITINLPEVELKEGMKYGFETENELLIYDNNWKKLKEFKYRNSGFSIGVDGKSFIEALPCNSLCNSISKPNIDGEMKILITGKLYSKIANTVLSACLYDTDACRSIEIDIDKFGNIDRELLLQKNPIFRDIFK